MDILALICILGAIIVFLIETYRSGLAFIPLGLLFLSLFIAVTFIPTLSS